MITFFTVTGRQLDLEHPRESDVDVQDIAHGLSMICRYGGQVANFYSVAQHACMVASLVRPSLGFPALNHDDSEAYLGDMTSKLKHSPEMRWFRELEDQWTATINRALHCDGVYEQDWREIKVADDVAAVYERVTLRYCKSWEGEADFRTALDHGWVTHSTLEEMMALAHRLPLFIGALDHHTAKSVFLSAFQYHASLWR